MSTAPHLYILTAEDSAAYCAGLYHRPDIELEVSHDLIQRGYWDLVEIVTTTGHTAFYYLNGRILEV